MHREIQSWYSPVLNKEMEIVEYGHFGPVILLLPTAAADYLEYERFLMIDVLKKYIENGEVKVYSINSINSESWLNNKLDGRSKVVRHNQFNRYVYDEVIPFIKNRSGLETPVYTCGASFGALHAANLFFKNLGLSVGVSPCPAYTISVNTLKDTGMKTVTGIVHCIT